MKEKVQVVATGDPRHQSPFSNRQCTSSSSCHVNSVRRTGRCFYSICKTVNGKWVHSRQLFSFVCVFVFGVQAKNGPKFCTHAHSSKFVQLAQVLDAQTVQLHVGGHLFDQRLDKQFPIWEQKC